MNSLAHAYIDESVDTCISGALHWLVTVHHGVVQNAVPSTWHGSEETEEWTPFLSRLYLVAWETPPPVPGTEVDPDQLGWTEMRQAVRIGSR